MRVCSLTTPSISQGEQKMLTRKNAKMLTDRLDTIANQVQKRYEAMGLTKQAAYDFCMYLDQTSDLVERTAKTLDREPDEPYMDTFDHPMAPHEMEADEPYMRHFEDDNDSQLADHPDLTPMHTASNWYEQEKTASASNWYEEDNDSWY